MADDSAFFSRDDDWYIGNGSARGPWTDDACHAGPVTAVVAGELEKTVTDKQLVRLTIVFRRPVPLMGFRVDTVLDRDGRSASTASATILGRDDKVYGTATSMHIVADDFENMPTSTIPAPDPTTRVSGQFPVRRARHGLPFFGNSIEVGYLSDAPKRHGPNTMWVRSSPIVEGETPTPFQTMCPISDCGNGISSNADFSSTSFVNPDLTIVAYRLPESEWLASEAISFWEPTGIGMSQATLFDERGSIGTALQTLIVRPMS